MSGAAPKSKPKATKPKKPAAHPPMGDMIKKAIATLAERTGSSRIAIQKWVSDNYKLPNTEAFKKVLNLSLKKGVAAGRLRQVKGSFKLAAAEPKKKAPKKKAAKKKTTKKVVKKPAAAATGSPKKAAPKKKPAAKKATSPKPKKAASKKKPAAKKPAAKKVVKPKKKASPKKASKPKAKAKAKA
uniref:H15 domain-containing protein n=1 Tax=Chromera velia CCMP2878 TaxID=1169474 RepID=A0A0G4G3W4_9ALVE|mmetsp:Transcript_2948/g.6030  ORF Transcript_2948/g.6030 Transcript_2948/m.6030 type:complete len:185 (+) Transcript_2948:81-635(+)|eukprot:Cvel_20161.t1-p1 / transcript=Cvel_20161.t1 / gene=Cvel_20161 / organism=Chromera_velia_CCMP2878 / gene_product=Histone H1, putative / transcript_product=Histone H1, putative / location=Cvel_scaffold1790:29836-30387(+) / protein_length=184 / sequence_SO=supercontig / SO=protein_coding / is_pseudo=false